MPIRIQRKRTKGWRMQEQSPDGAPVVYVGRPSKWGNPFREGYMGTTPAEEFEDYLHVEATLAAEGIVNLPAVLRDIEELRGKHLCCWCKLSDECHANVLLDLANRGN